MAGMSKEEYLKRYLSGPDSDTKPKKKKKKLKNAVQKTTQSRLLFKVYFSSPECMQDCPIFNVCVYLQRS